MSMIINPRGRFGAVIDACVIVCMPVCDTLLRLAEHQYYRPFWTEIILDEAERAITTLPNVSAPRARRRVNRMKDAFPEAMVSNIETLTFGLPDPDDEHVLTAAVKSEAQVIVTFNLKHFPSDICSRHDIEAVHPDDFLVDQFDLKPDGVRNVIYAQAGATQSPALGIPTVLTSLHTHVPRFANRVRQEIWQDIRMLVELDDNFPE